MNRSEIANVLGVSLPTIDKYIKHGMPFESHGSNGKAYKFDLEKVAKWWMRQDDNRYKRYKKDCELVKSSFENAFNSEKHFVYFIENICDDYGLTPQQAIRIAGMYAQVTSWAAEEHLINGFEIELDKGAVFCKLADFGFDGYAKKLFEQN